MKKIAVIIKTLHLLSLDVVLGAVFCNIMFWKLPSGNTPVNKLAVVVLAITIWLIYVIDRLLDIKKPSQNPTARHLFHQKYHKVLWYCVYICSGICGILVCLLPFYGIIAGIVIASFTAIYLFVVDRIEEKSHVHFYKEPITAILYVSGVWGITYLDNLTPLFFTTGFLFLLIAFQNLLLFSLLEFKKHPNDCHTLAHYFGLRNSNQIIWIITILIFISGVFSINISVHNFQKNVFVIEILMSFILLIINLFDTFFIVNERYRWVGDGIFFLPLLIIW